MFRLLLQSYHYCSDSTPLYLVLHTQISSLFSCSRRCSAQLREACRHSRHQRHQYETNIQPAFDSPLLTGTGERHVCTTAFQDSNTSIFELQQSRLRAGQAYTTYARSAPSSQKIVSAGFSSRKRVASVPLTRRVQLRSIT